MFLIKVMFNDVEKFDLTHEVVNREESRIGNPKILDLNPGLVT